MPIYLVSTPEGPKVVHAASQKDAVEHCVEGLYQAEPLGAVKLAELISSGMTIEKTAKIEGPADDTGQEDIEDHIEKQAA